MARPQRIFRGPENGVSGLRSRARDGSNAGARSAVFVVVAISATISAAAEAGSKAYVENGTEVVVIDTETRATTKTLTFPGEDALGPLAATPDGSKVYVGTYSAAPVWVIDTATDEIASSVLASAYTCCIAIDRSRAYIADGLFGDLFVVDTGTTQVVDTAAGPPPIDGIAVRPVGSHLHLEVDKQVGDDKIGIPVDPYGWQVAGCPDPSRIDDPRCDPYTIPPKCFWQSGCAGSAAGPTAAAAFPESPIVQETAASSSEDAVTLGSAPRTSTVRSKRSSRGTNHPDRNLQEWSLNPCQRQITIDEIRQAVHAALDRCPGGGG